MGMLNWWGMRSRWGENFEGRWEMKLGDGAEGVGETHALPDRPIPRHSVEKLNPAKPAASSLPW
jgi:hypothetical protein